MPTFYDNLRASRGGPNQTLNALPTRGDMQKERRPSQAPSSFTDLLRVVLGTDPAARGKEQLSIDSVSPENLDKMSPESAQEYDERKMMNIWGANRRALNLEKDLGKYNAAVEGDMYGSSRYSTLNDAYDVFQNYAELNKVLDEYDTIDTWVGKRRFLDEAYQRFNRDQKGIAEWFDQLREYTTQAQNADEWDPRRVSDAMRRINEGIKNRLQKIS